MASERDRRKRAKERALAEAVAADISQLLTRCSCGSTGFSVSKKTLDISYLFIDGYGLGADNHFGFRLASCVGCKRTQIFLVSAPTRLDFEIVDIANNEGYR